MKDLQTKNGLTYLFISHDLSVVEYLADTVGVMYLGSLVELATKEQIFSNPKHPYTQALLSAVPIPDPDKKMNRIILEGDIPSASNPPKGCKFHTRCPNCMEFVKNKLLFGRLWKWSLYCLSFIFSRIIKNYIIRL